MKLSCTDKYKAIPGNRHLPKLVTGGPVDLMATVVLAVTRVPRLIHPWEGIDQELQINGNELRSTEGFSCQELRLRGRTTSKINAFSAFSGQKGIVQDKAIYKVQSTIKTNLGAALGNCTGCY